jgi:hypothetical protein
MPDPQVQRLLDIEAIKQLRARYCLFLDAQEWDELRALFADDARAVISTGTHESADALLASMRERLTGEDHVHFAVMPIIEVDGDTARGLWGFSNRGALGHYQEEYRRVDGVWKIAVIEQTWIHEPSEELRTSRRNAFHLVADQWRAIASRWSRLQA